MATHTDPHLQTPPHEPAHSHQHAHAEDHAHGHAKVHTHAHAHAHAHEPAVTPVAAPAGHSPASQRSMLMQAAAQRLAGAAALLALLWAAVAWALAERAIA